MNTFLFLAIVISALCCIWFVSRQNQRLFYLFKPLTIGLIIVCALLGENKLPFYRLMIIAGLILSMIGDIFLMLPTDQFLAGLTAFLLAHLCYITAFVSLINGVSWWLPVIYMVISVGFIYFLFPKLGPQKEAVIVYIFVITIMVWMATEVLFQTPQPESLIVFLGALLFALSDFVLSLNRFQGTFKFGRAVTLALYFTAQTLMAASVGVLVN